LLLQGSGFSIQLMHRILRAVVVAVVLVAFSLGATNSVPLLSAGLKATAGGQSCPLHTAKCCCPKVCKTPPKARPSCHKSTEPVDALSTAKAAPGAACVLKAGCDKNEPHVGFLPLLKDFVPESSEQIGFDPSLSIFIHARSRFVLLDCSPQLFHPPRNS